MDGFIRLNRKFFTNVYWSQQRTFSLSEAWLDLIQMARFDAEPATKELPNGRLITIKRGEIHAGLRFLSDRWGWSVEKTQRYINKHIKKHEIERRTEHGESIISLCNYEYYNPMEGTLPNTISDTISDTTPYTARTLTSTNNKKDKEYIHPPYPPSGGTAGAGTAEPGRSPDISSESFTDTAGRAADGGPGALLWRGDFTVYQAEAKSALEQLKTDQEFIAEQQRFYPGVDIGMSMEKAYCNFWGIPDGWEHKKRQRSRTINWKSTYRNALSLKSNQVAAGTALHQEPRPVKPIRLL